MHILMIGYSILFLIPENRNLLISKLKNIIKELSEG